MKYDFTAVIDRHGMDSIAVDPPDHSPYRAGFTLREGFDHIPMWVADMNFATAPTIQQAILTRTQHPTFGYFLPREEYYDSIIRWQGKRNGVQGLKREHIGYENGVLGGVSSALRALCTPGDTVLLHSPTYVGFTHVLENGGYHAEHSPLVRDAQGVWRMDYEDMDRRLKDKHIHTAIFCSPHNPCGRVWERWEIERAMAVFAANDVYVISDEIWSDLIRPGLQHVPTQSVGEDARMRTVALYAPSKTFNLAGLIGSYHVIYNARVRDRVRREGSLSHYNSMNLLSMYALLGAYCPEGEEWLEELRTVIAGNVDFAVDYIRAHFDGVELFRPEGTYMLFLDCARWCRTHGKTLGELLRAGYEVGVDWQNGEDFLLPCSIRVNLALPRSRVEEAFDRLNRYVFNA